MIKQAYSLCSLAKDTNYSTKLQLIFFPVIVSFSLSRLQVKHGYSDVKEMFRDFTLLVWWQLGRKKKYQKGKPQQWYNNSG